MKQCAVDLLSIHIAQVNWVDATDRVACVEQGDAATWDMHKKWFCETKGFTLF